MLDVAMMALGVGFFVASVLYVLACERMGDAARLRPRLDRDHRDHGLSRLRTDQPRAVLGAFDDD